MTGEHRPLPSTHVLTIAVVCFVLGLLCLGLIGCSESPTAPTFSLYRWDVLSTAENCLHNARPIQRSPDRVLLQLAGFQFVQWDAEHVIALFEVSSPFYKFCSVLTGATV